MIWWRIEERWSTGPGEVRYTAAESEAEVREELETPPDATFEAFRGWKIEPVAAPPEEWLRRQIRERLLAAAGYAEAARGLIRLHLEHYPASAWVEAFEAMAPRAAEVKAFALALAGEAKKTTGGAT